MLELLFQADEAIKIPHQRKLLDALLEDDTREMLWVMEDSEDHDILFADDFFTPFMGILADQGSPNAFRVLEDWGYSMRSRARLDDDKEGLEIGNWVASFLEPSRLKDLIEWGTLKPFEGISNTSKLTACEHGMMGGSPELFDFWLPYWIARHTPKIAFNGLIPNVFKTAAGLLLWQEKPYTFAAPYPSNCPDHEELLRRIDGLVNTIVEFGYKASTPYAQLEAVLEKPPHVETAWPLFVFISSIIRRIEDPWKDPDLLRKAQESKNNHLLEALIRSGAPLDTSYGTRLPALLLNDILNKEASNEAWEAWRERAQHEVPHLFAKLPDGLKEPNAKVHLFFKKNEDERKAKLDAIELNMSSVEAPIVSRSKPRL